MGYRRWVRRPRSFLALALALGTLVPAGTDAAQPDDVRTRLEAAATATEGLHAMRFTMVMTVRTGGGIPSVSNEAMARCLADTGDPPGCMATLSSEAGASPVAGLTQRLTVSGEFQSPDRIRTVMEQEPFGTMRYEGIVIGEMWTRTGDGQWRLGVPGPGPLHPRLLGQALRELGGMLRNPVVSEQGGRLVVSGDVELTGGGAVDSALLPLFGGPGVSGFGSDPQLRSKVTLTLDRATGFLLDLEADTRVTATPPQFPSPQAPEGATFAPFPMEQGMATRLTLSDFNDPSIRVARPR